jgi:hypothetical protein
MQDRQNGNRMLRRIPECTERERQEAAQKMSEPNGQNGNRMLRRIPECSERERQAAAQKMSEPNRQSGNRILRRILEGKRESNENRITHYYIMRNYIILSSNKILLSGSQTSADICCIQGHVSRTTS